MSSQQPATVPQIPIPAINLANIQGDVLDGLPKKAQTFVFFKILDQDGFKSRLPKVIPYITSVLDVRNDRDTIKKHKAQGHQGGVDVVGTNVAFSQQGLFELGILDALNDPVFSAGQLADASQPFPNGIADPGTLQPDGKTIDPDWDHNFKQTIDGVFLVTGSGSVAINRRIHDIEIILLGTIRVLFYEHGLVRPGDQKGHEPFGFKDCISNPPIIGVKMAGPDEDPTMPGVILIGEAGDPQLATGKPGRPAWAKDGSFLAFRKLRQRVPEFNNFLLKNPIQAPGLTPEQGSELLGARMVGRWKSGEPIDRSPQQDNPADAADPDKINNFNYTDDLTTGARCPFTAHLRKTNPRSGTVPGAANVEPRRIMRHGIPYGHEVTPEEAASGTTLNDRGLLFVCYQSDLAFGFQFVQKTWANNIGFPNANVGFDPIIGQAGNGPRFVTGTDPNNLKNSLTLPDGNNLWVVPRGGEYFFTPSISALKTRFTA